MNTTTKPKNGAPKGGAEEEETGKAVAMTGSTAVPAHLQQAIDKDAGKGVSSASEDNIVPMVMLLQPLSPQVNVRDPKHVKDATPGDIILKGASIPLIKAEEGIVVQPCFFHKTWVEWVPRGDGGGFVGHHDELPANVIVTTDPKNAQRKRFTLPNGNELVETRYHSVLIYLPGLPAPLAYVIPFTSTGHTVSRNWMFMMNNKQANGQRAPSFAGLYRLKPTTRRNAQGEWWVFNIEDLGWVPTENAYNAGRQLYESFASGQKHAEAPEQRDEVAQEGDAGTSSDQKM